MRSQPIIEIGSDVEYHKIGDLVSVPFNVACGAAAIVARTTPVSA
jgi:threonine dehydrogenase-like Zn-dependent dehydrogenase